MARAPRPAVPVWPVLVWVGLSLAFTMSAAGMNAVKAVEEPFAVTWWYAGSEWLFYGALSPFVVALVRRLSFERPHLPRTIALLGLGWLVFHVVLWSAYSLVEQLLRIGSPPREMPGYQLMLFTFLTKRAAFSLMVFLGIVVVTRLRTLAAVARERQLRAAHLETALATARLDALQGQLQPHFLFNALNTVASLIPAEPEKAEAVLARIGDLLRITLQEGNVAMVPLERELDFLERYLDIQRLRFADRLRVEMAVSAEAQRAMVPTLLLQPLAENAIKHGIEPLPAGGTLRIAGARDDGQLRITVRDTGVGITSNGTNGRDTAGHGVGLANTRLRLTEMFGEAARLTVAPATGGGTLVEIVLPWREGDAGA
jgi:signal transduction histidine kinase